MKASGPGEPRVAELLKLLKASGDKKKGPNEKIKLPKIPFDSSPPLGFPNTIGWPNYRGKKLKS